MAAPIRAEAVRIFVAERASPGLASDRDWCGDRGEESGLRRAQRPSQRREQPVEVKRWGEGFLSASSGRFVYHQGIRTEADGVRRAWIGMGCGS
jgi:hypothetical protein